MDWFISPPYIFHVTCDNEVAYMTRAGNYYCPACLQDVPEDLTQILVNLHNLMDKFHLYE